MKSDFALFKKFPPVKRARSVWTKESGMATN